MAPDVPKMANMLEGGGSTPICTPAELEDMGFKVVAYPLSLLACTVRSIENTLRDIKHEGYPDESTLPTFEDCLLYTSPSPRDATLSRMPSSA